MVISYQEPTLLTIGNCTTNGRRAAHAADAIGYSDQLLMLSNHRKVTLSVEQRSRCAYHRAKRIC